MCAWSPRRAVTGRLGAVALVYAVALLGAHAGCEDNRISPATFEDIYGPSAASFQGAVGFRVAEATTATGDAQTSFGVTIDDMVVQWREFKLVDDATDCATSGACATVSADTAIFHEANGSVGITVIDSSPYGQTIPVNDCNQDGDFVDAGIDDQDCNDNGATDVLVRASSTAEPAGELVVLDRVGAGVTYRGTLAISTVANVTGVLLPEISPPSLARLTIRYDDRWDGSASGSECRASSAPAEWGFVSTGVEIPITTGQLAVVTYRISDAPGSGTPPLPAGQDADGFPDTNETVDLFLTVRNATSQPLTNLTAQVTTSDPKVSCLLRSMATLGSVPAHSNADFSTPIRFKVAATADRFGVAPVVTCVAGACSNGAGACTSASTCKKSTTDSYAAIFTVLLAADQFASTVTPQPLRVELDLNASAPLKATSTFTEGFEGGLGNMTLLNLDDSIQNNTLSNGRRCQYYDPDFAGSEGYGETECYLGFATGQGIVNDWHLEDTPAPDGGRAYEGFRSLHYGIDTPGNPGLMTYGLSQMDAIRTKNAINLAPRVCRDDPSGNKRACSSATDCTGFGGGPCVSASPELSFKHQIFVSDPTIWRWIGEAADRAVVQAQVVTAGALWETLVPYLNVYDALGMHDGYQGICMFDPIDDGNTEDDYFDPADPNRRFGPSSTCYPQFVFSCLGDTDAPFDPTQLCHASEGPGLQGSLGIGTWVESKFDLSRFRGRSIRIRWLVTSAKVHDVAQYEAFFHWNPYPGDDGWFVDDVRVTQTLGTSATTIAQDTADNSALPGCGVACSTLAAALSATPPTSAAPGWLVRLSTYGSLADRCNAGVLLSEFWIDGDANGALGDPGDVVLRSPTVDPLFEEAPRATTHYGARVFCSSAPSCSDTAFVVVTVGCPGTPGVFNAEAWWTQLQFSDKTTLVVPAAGQMLDAARGDLLALRASGSFGGVLCLADGTTATTVVDSAAPALGDGFYYLVRGADTACNENRSWRTFSLQENPGDPARRDTQIAACPP